MPWARHAAKKRKGPALAAAGAGVALLGGVVALGQIDARIGSQPTPEPSGTGAPMPSSSVQVTPTPTAETTRDAGTPVPTTRSTPATPTNSAAVIAACHREIAAGEAVVRAAGTTADGWREHLQARTDLLAGKVSKATTDRIWNQTFQQGPKDLAQLTAATAARTRVKGACGKLVGPSAPACEQRLAALEAAAAAGRATAADWADHLEKMTAYAAGHFSRQHAQALWVAAYQGAPKNLNTFAKAEAAVAKSPPCRPA